MSMTLVPVDSSLRREREWSLYQKACDRLDMQTQKLKIHETQEIDAYRQWLESHFSAELNEIHSLQNQLAERKKLIQDVEYYALCTEVPEHVSYALIHQARLEGTLDQLWEDLEKAEEGSQKKDPKIDELWRELENFLGGRSDRFERHAEEEPQRGHPREEDFFHGKALKQNPKPHPDQDEYLKGLYHKLLMKLHPDKNPEQSEAQKAAFFQVQEAYLWRDGLKLERLYRQVMASDQDLIQPETAPIGEIIARRKKVEKQLRSMNQQLKEAKSDPAWGFLKSQSNPKSLARLAQDMHSSLAANLEVLRMEFDKTQDLIGSWEKRSRSSIKPRKTKMPLSKARK